MILLRALAAATLAVWTVSIPASADLESSPIRDDKPAAAMDAERSSPLPKSVLRHEDGGMTPEERASHAAFRADRGRRMKERREKAKAKIRARLSRPEGKLERLTGEELERISAKASAADAAAAAAKEGGDGAQFRRKTANADAETVDIADEAHASKPANYQFLRRAGWSGGGSSSVPSNYDPYGDVGPGLADPGGEYDMWQQGYRMLGGYIDCDNDKDNDHHRRRRRAAEGGDEKAEAKYEQDERDLSGSDDGNFGCSRWMMWAAYVNPNYQGGGYDEYFGDGCGDDGSEPCSSLDCHEDNTEWELLGVYRQEFYQYVEQISKHLWAIDEYEYIVALAGLAYMTKYDCKVAGYDGNGNAIYAGVQPLEGGRWQMSLYSDEDCLFVNEDSGYTYDDFGYESDMSLSSKDDGDGNCNYDDDGCGDAQEYWEASQEYTLTNLNDVYDNYKYCTPCMDYPTYQDGYFIGDYGTDEDDLINQCWKFHSHDSFTCEGNCISLGADQASILRVRYGDRYFGDNDGWDSSGSFSYESSSSTFNQNHASGASSSRSSGSRMESLKSNLFLTFCGILFVATFLAFAVARGSGRKDRSGKSRSLLTPEERARARQARRSRSNGRRSRSAGRRSKSRSRRTGTASGDDGASPRRSSRGSGRREGGRTSSREAERTAGRSASRSRRTREAERERRSKRSSRSSSRRQRHDDF